MWIGRAFVSTMAWSLVEKPPRERPRALHRTPLFRPTHPDVRERRSHQRSSRSYRPQAAARGRSSPSGPFEPSSRSGCTRSSKGRTARADHATAIRFSLGRERLPRRADRRAWPSGRYFAAADAAAAEPTERRSMHDGACRSLITPTIPAQVSSAAIGQVIEKIQLSDRAK